MTIGADFDLSVQIGNLADKIDKDMHDRIRAREIARARVPAIVRFQNAGTIPSPTVPFGLSLGGPDAGFEWVVRRIIVGGLTWSTTAAGTAEVYVTGLGTILGSTSAGGVSGVRSLSDLVDQSTALPNKAFYGRDELVVKENESLVVVINGGTAGQQYVATAGVQVVRTVAVAWGAAQGM